MHVDHGSIQRVECWRRVGEPFEAGERAAWIHGSRGGMWATIAAVLVLVASGINSTLRQAGIATGVAGLGTIFTAQVGSGIAAHLSGSALAGRATVISKALANGSLVHAIASSSPALPGAVAGAARAAIR